MAFHRRLPRLSCARRRAYRHGVDPARAADACGGILRVPLRPCHVGRRLFRIPRDADAACRARGGGRRCQQHAARLRAALLHDVPRRRCAPAQRRCGSGARLPRRDLPAARTGLRHGAWAQLASLAGRPTDRPFARQPRSLGKRSFSRRHRHPALRPADRPFRPDRERRHGQAIPGFPGRWAEQPFRAGRVDRLCLRPRRRPHPRAPRMPRIWKPALLAHHGPRAFAGGRATRPAPAGEAEGRRGVAGDGGGCRAAVDDARGSGALRSASAEPLRRALDTLCGSAVARHSSRPRPSSEADRRAT